MSGELKGQVAIVTGGGRGFGRAIAQRFAAEGAAVTVTSRTTTQLEDTVRMIEEQGGRALAVSGDVARRKDVEQVVAATEKQFGKVTLLVNNAGVPDPFGPIGVVDPDRWWAAQEVHIRAPFLYISAVLPSMLEQGTGRIINISAIGGKVVAPYLSAYCVGKAAQIRLTELLAAETRDQGISVFAIDPGFVITALAEQTIASPDAQRWLPDMVKRLSARKQELDAGADLARCQQRCVDLASGRYDMLSGKYLVLDDDLDDLLLQLETDDITIIPSDH
ncbi:MAG: putative oxidoreductase [Gammaproteobacteria bacterium]|nr:putative oxidoreductase [Gammaproteobacteria bacterium]